MPFKSWTVAPSVGARPLATTAVMRPASIITSTSSPVTVVAFRSTVVVIAALPLSAWRVGLVSSDDLPTACPQRGGDLADRPQRFVLGADRAGGTKIDAAHTVDGQHFTGETRRRIDTGSVWVHGGLDGFDEPC